MAIDMACWREAGPFDEEAFGKGYGEEADWCMRADSRGWKIVLVLNLFVQYAPYGGGTVFSSLAERKRTQALQKEYENAMSGARRRDPGAAGHQRRQGTHRHIAHGRGRRARFFFNIGCENPGLK